MNMLMSGASGKGVAPTAIDAGFFDDKSICLAEACQCAGGVGAYMGGVVIEIPG